MIKAGPGGSIAAEPGLQPAREPSRIIHVQLPATPVASRLARRATAGALTLWQLAHLQETAGLIVSELVTNAVLHANPGGSGIGLRLEVIEDWLRIEVHDPDPRMPQPRIPAALDQTGFGFVIVGGLADKWGAGETEEGKAVWAQLATARIQGRHPDPPAHRALLAPHQSDSVGRPATKTPQAGQGARDGAETCPVLTRNGGTAADLRERKAASLKATAYHPARSRPIQLERKAPRRRRATTRTVMDLIWKTDYGNGLWTGTLRNEPSVVLTADNGEELHRLMMDLTFAILEGHGREALRAMTAANAA
jgi:anti-sigma regulatory factor (Ser/Thr protein kinase)